ETLLPLIVRLPVTWQTLDIRHLGGSRKFRMGAFLGQESDRPRRYVGVHGQRAIRERCRGMRRLGPAGPGIALPEAAHAGLCRPAGHSEPGIITKTRPLGNWLALVARERPRRPCSRR